MKAFIVFTKEKAIWIICILSFFSAFFYNELNYKHLPQHKKRANETVITNDDQSYLTPPTTYLETGIWREGNIGNQSYFTRPPGYGIIYYLLLKTVGPQLSLQFLKIIQLLLFTFSIYWFYYISISILKSKRTALIGSCIYGITPFAIGFLYYTLTEGVTPALLLLYVFLLFKAKNKVNDKIKTIFYFLAALSFSYLMLIRPVLGVFGILLPVFLVKDYWKMGLFRITQQLIIFSSIAFSLTAIWQIRNYKITHEYVGLHPIYHDNENSIYRPPFKAYWNFVKGWGEEGHIAYSYMIPLWKSAIDGDTSIYYINEALKTFPSEVITHFGKDKLIHAFKKYQQAILFQKYFYDKKLPMPTTTSGIEKEVVQEFQQLTTEYKSNFWTQYHLLSPLKVFGTMAFHSNLSLHIFQHTYRGNCLMETTRWFFFLLHSLCFLTLILNLLFIKKVNIINYGILCTLFIYISFLCYFQRGIEERYTLPILSLLIIGLFDLIRRFINQIKEKLC